MSTRKVLFQSAPFCFGPAATSLNIIEELIPYGHDIRICGERPVDQLVRRAGLDEALVRDVNTQRFDDATRRAVEEADLVVSNTDLGFAARCAALGAPVVVVDNLFWMWDCIDDVLMRESAFVVQDFYGVDEQIARLGRPDRLTRVGPLVRSQPPPLPTSAREDLIVVSFGGCDAEMQCDQVDPCPARVLRHVERTILDLPDPPRRVVVTVGEAVARTLSPTLGQVEVKTVSNQDHVELLRRAKAALAAPGLAVMMEAFDAATPVFFLPPMNYSQSLQLQSIAEAGLPYADTWSAMDAGPLPRFRPEEEGVGLVRDQLEAMSAREGAWRVFRQRLAAFLAGDSWKELVERQTHIRALFGNDGPREAAATIHRCLESIP